MGQLKQLHERFGQSPWLDDLRRDWLEDGTLQSLIDRGVRGVTSNPSTFEKAVAKSEAYAQQLKLLVPQSRSERDLYWPLVLTDVRRALDLFLPLHEASGGQDGFVSLELAPEIAHDAEESIRSAQSFLAQINLPNLLVKVPATAAGVVAVRELISRGQSINVTLLFSLERYDQIIEAYLSGLEANKGDLSSIHSVASFFVSRVDVEVARRLPHLGARAVLELDNQLGAAQAKLAYQHFREHFSGERWRALVKRGAHPQRLLWASTSVKDPHLPPAYYAEQLIGPETVDTMPIELIEVVDRLDKLDATLEQGAPRAQAMFDHASELGLDVADVSRVLEAEGIAKFEASFQHTLTALRQQAARFDPRWSEGRAK
jgi:transaldolase